jgi:hypothetical protein
VRVRLGSRIAEGAGGLEHAAVQRKRVGEVTPKS